MADTPKGGTWVRVKSGKLYILIRAFNSDLAQLNKNGSGVLAQQWLVNEKYPYGRWYGALRYLKLGSFEVLPESESENTQFP